MSDPATSGPPTAEDLHCPVCDYSLRGLPEPRCPECGYAFEWDELIELARRRQSWFYEHAGTLRSHARTRLESLRHWSFWRQIHAYTDADRQRLRRYRWATFALLIVVGMLCCAWPYEQRRLANYLVQVQYSYWRFRPPGAMPWWATVLLPLVRRSYVGDGGVALMCVSSSAALCVAVGLPLYWWLLRLSVLKAQILPIHLARINAYTMDILPVVLLPALFGQSLGSPTDYVVPSARLGWGVVSAILVPTIVVGVLVVRLAWALRRYVRFPQAGAVALAYGLMAGLAWMTLLMVAQFHF